MKICDGFGLTAQNDLVQSPLDPPSSEDEVYKLISNFPSKSCQLDPWPTFLVEDCLDILLPSITTLVNYSLSEGVVPSGFKQEVTIIMR